MKRDLVLYLMIISLILLVLTIYIGKSPFVYFDSKWGFAGQLPASFWLGMGFLLASLGLILYSRKPEPSSSICLMWLLLLVGFWNVYVFVQPSPLRPDSFAHFSEVLRLVDKGSLDVVRYGMGGWPGLFIWGYAYFSITGLPAVLIMQGFPILSSLTLVLSVFFIVKRLFGSNFYSLVSSALALTANAGLEYIFTPNSLAAALLPLLFLPFVNRTKERRFFVVFMVVYTAVIYTYGIFSIYFAAVLLVAGVALAFKRYAEVSANYILVTVVIALSYLLFRAQFGLERGLYILKQAFTSFNIGTHVQSLTPTLVYPNLELLRTGTLLASLSLAGLTIVFSLISIVRRRRILYAFLLYANVVSVLLLLLSPYLHFALPSTRAWYPVVLSASLSTPLILSRLRVRRMRQIFSLLIIAVLSVGGFVALHAYDSYLVPPVSEVAMSRFLGEHWTGSVIIDNRYPELPLEFYSPQGNFSHQPYPTGPSLLPSETGEILAFKYSTFSYFFLYGKQEEYHNLQTNLSNCQFYDALYDSSTNKVFIATG